MKPPPKGVKGPTYKVAQKTDFVNKLFVIIFWSFHQQKHPA